MTELKKPDLDHPVHELIARRWSPYIFDEREIPRSDLLSLFEAARWAPSAMNEQPWRFLVAPRADTSEFDRLLSCLVEGNQVWARHASALVLGVVKSTYTYKGRPNPTALHDLGLAVANLTLEATSRGISVHQMGGILPDRARELYSIPEDFKALIAIALGYPGPPVGEVAERDTAKRTRRRIEEFVFRGTFGTPME